MAIDDGGVSIELLRQMLNANDPEEVARHAREWKSLAGELYDIAPEVDRIIADLGDSFDTQHAGPAFKAKLAEAVNDLDVTAGRVDRNGNLVIQAADAWRRARDAANSANSDRDAQPIRSELSEEHAAIAAQLDLFPEAKPRGGGGRPPGDDADRPGGPGRDSGLDGGGGIAAPLSRTGTGGMPSPGPFNPGPTLGGRTTGGWKVGSGSGAGMSGTGAGAGVGAGAGAGAGAGGGAKVGLTGGRSGAPIGGYRPAVGTPGAGGGSTPPGGSTPAKAGPGGPARPAAVPPGGAGPGQPGRNRPGRRLTNYEKLEPNVFRDTRHRVKPVLGEQRIQPDTFEQTRGAIGGNQSREETRKTPDLPTRKSPVRIEGHDVSVSRRSRRAGP